MSAIPTTIKTDPNTNPRIPATCVVAGRNELPAKPPNMLNPIIIGPRKTHTKPKITHSIPKKTTAAAPRNALPQVGISLPLAGKARRA